MERNEVRPLDFSVGVKFKLVLSGGLKLAWFSVRIELDMFFVRGSKLTLFLFAGRKLLVFRVSMEIGLIFCVGGRN